MVALAQAISTGMRHGGRAPLAKCPTGIAGLDEVTDGGLPRGRTTLVSGGPGCGKTLMAVEFLVRGAMEHGEPGVFLAFEETPEDLAQNVASCGFDLDRLIADRLLVVDHILIERHEIEETGEYDLEGLFIRLGHDIATIGARRVALDTIETLFAGLPNSGILRSELRRLFRWLSDQQVTAVVTAERGDGTLTRHGLEEYVSDCVILLDQRVSEQVSTRRLRMIKYRGSSHATNEFPFMIDNRGCSVVPITSLALAHEALAETISTGVPELDAMFAVGGVYRASTMLVSGPAGTGKTSLAAAFARAAAERGERCLYLAFEESPSQIVRNMRSVGIDLQPWVERDLLRFHATRSTAHGLEAHLATVYRLVHDFSPQAVVVDPITDFDSIGTPGEVKIMLTRLADFLKARQVTALFTSLTGASAMPEQSETGISSLIDIWLQLRNLESSGERNRGLSILKARGVAHSNQVREFTLTGSGIELRDVYSGPSGMLTGSARLSQEAVDRETALVREQELQHARQRLSRQREKLEARIAALRAEFKEETLDLEALVQAGELRAQQARDDRDAMARSRRAGVAGLPGPNGGQGG